MSRHLPLYDFSKKIPVSRERECPLTSPWLAQPDITGHSGDEATAARENVRYQRGALFPGAPVVICLICQWVEGGRGEGSVQSLATEKSHEVIGTHGFPR